MKARTEYEMIQMELADLRHALKQVRSLDVQALETLIEYTTVITDLEYKIAWRAGQLEERDRIRLMDDGTETPLILKGQPKRIRKKKTT